MAKMKFKDLENASISSSKIDNLFPKMRRVQEVINSIPDEQKVDLRNPAVSLSKQGLVFISVNTEKSGKFVEILDLNHCKESEVSSELDKRINHIRGIAQRHLKKP